MVIYRRSKISLRMYMLNHDSVIVLGYIFDIKENYDTFSNISGIYFNDKKTTRKTT